MSDRCDLRAEDRHSLWFWECNYDGMPVIFDWHSKEMSYSSVSSLYRGSNVVDRWLGTFGFWG